VNPVRIMSVTIVPGQMQFTVTLNGASSTAITWVIATTAALDAEYVPHPGQGTLATCEAVLTILP
jgi:hypothetical protein